MLDISLLTVDVARTICDRHGVELHVTDDVEPLPRIRPEETAADDLPAVVDAVAEAIGRINNAARRPELRWPPE